MSKIARKLRAFTQCDGIAAAEQKWLVAAWSWLLIVVSLATLAVPMTSLAESRVGSTGAGAGLNFRIVIPAIIRVTAVTQPDRIVIEDRHIAQGYIDIEAGTSVRLTNNSRDGYQLAASYDSRLLSRIEVHVSNQNLTASSGYGSMRVASGLMTDKLVPISYRLHLAPGARAGHYRWPVALAFSLAVA